MNHGRCFSATIKSLGYPCRGTLAEWVRERYPEIGKCVVGKAGKPAVSTASKRTAVYELCTREGSAQGIAQRLIQAALHERRVKIHDTIVANWELRSGYNCATTLSTV